MKNIYPWIKVTPIKSWLKKHLDTVNPAPVSKPVYIIPQVRGVSYSVSTSYWQVSKPVYIIPQVGSGSFSVSTSYPLFKYDCQQCFSESIKSYFFPLLKILL